MKNIKEKCIILISCLLVIISLFILSGCNLMSKTSTNEDTKAIYVKRTKNGINTEDKNYINKSLMYNLSDDTQALVTDTTEASDEVSTSKSYNITIYTSDYNVEDATKLSQELFGIGLSIKDGGFKDNKYDAETAILYASITSTGDTNDLATLVSYVNCNIDVSIIGISQELIISTKVLKHESEGTYTVDSNYPEQITSVSLTISDNEAPVGTNINSINITQPDFIDSVISSADDLKAEGGDDKAETIREKVKQSLNTFIEKQLIDTVSNLNDNESVFINVSLIRDYDFLNLEISSFKDDDFKIPFTYTVTDEWGNSNNVNYTGDINIYVDSVPAKMDIIIDCATDDDDVISEIYDNCDWKNSNFRNKPVKLNDLIFIENYDSLDYVTNYTKLPYGNLGSDYKCLGKLDLNKIKNAGKDIDYVFNLYNSKQTLYYSIKYLGHNLVNDNYTERNFATYKYAAKFEGNYQEYLTYDGDEVFYFTSEDDVKSVVTQLIKSVNFDKDNLESKIQVKIMFIVYDDSNNYCRIKTEIYSSYHADSKVYLFNRDGSIDLDSNIKHFDANFINNYFNYIDRYSTADKYISFEVDLIND